jgi:hypothetical protein
MTAACQARNLSRRTAFAPRQAHLFLTLPPNRRFQMAIGHERSSQALAPMLFAISKNLRSGPIWLEDVVPGPKWSAHQDALCFHSETDARITLKFLPGGERRGAAVVGWPGSPLVVKLDDHPLDPGIWTVTDVRRVQDASSKPSAPIGVPAAQFIFSVANEAKGALKRPSS